MLECVELYFSIAFKSSHLVITKQMENLDKLSTTCLLPARFFSACRASFSLWRPTVCGEPAWPKECFSTRIRRVHKSFSSLFSGNSSVILNMYRNIHFVVTSISSNIKCFYLSNLCLSSPLPAFGHSLLQCCMEEGSWGPEGSPKELPFKRLTCMVVFCPREGRSSRYALDEWHSRHIQISVTVDSSHIFKNKNKNICAFLHLTVSLTCFNDTGLSKRFSLKMWSQKTGFMSLVHFYEFSSLLKRNTFLLGRATPAEGKPAEEYLFQKTHKYLLVV